MLKKIFLAAAVCFAFAACDDDYNDWSNPQANGQEDVRTVQVEVQAVPSIDLAEVDDEYVQVFTPTLTLQEAATAEYEVVLANADGTAEVTIAADAEGRVAKADLQSAIEQLYGRRPTQREIPAQVVAYVSINGEALKYVGTTTIRCTPVGPVIEQAYYLIGTHNGWSTETYKQYKFSHSDADVYEDPVFTITVPAPLKEDGSNDDFWFNIVPQSVADAAEFNWAALIGSAVGNGDDRKEATLSEKVDGADNAFCQYADDEVAYYVISLNMMDYTMTVTTKGKSPETWYLVGSCIGDGSWGNGGVENVGTSLVPLTQTGDSYTVISHTGWFPAGSGFKLIQTPGSWDAQWGASNGTFVKNDGGSGNIEVAADGYYTVTLNWVTDELTIEPAAITPTVHEQMGIAGGFNGWSFEAIQPVNTAIAHNHVWTCTLDASSGAQEGKFLTDSSWSTNWGAEGFPYGVGTQNGPNIPIAQGTWIVVFNDITGAYIFVEK